MNDTYDILLALHILAAVTWVGGNIAQQINAIRARKVGGREFAWLVDQISWAGTRVIMPASLVLILAGFGLVANGDWDLGEPWLIFALAVYVASFIMGAGYLGPRSAKVAEAMQANGGTLPAETQPLVDRLFLVSRIELVLLILVVIDMAVKPGV